MEVVMRFRARWLTNASTAFIVLRLVLVSALPLAAQEGRKAALLNPDALKEQAPATYKVNFDTSAGPFVIEVHRAWAPHGADRFYNLVKNGFYDGNRFYRVTDLVANFGIHGDREVAKAWLGKNIPDDPARTLGPSSGELNPKGASAQSNKKGFVAFSQPGANRRSTQVIIHLDDNSTLDSQMTPFGQVISGMNVVEKLYKGYGEPAPTGKGPMLTPLYAEGNAYLEREFPRLDYIKTTTIVQ
jgi:peptidyl-prolyl cis-trans isomerase A (cyclophilin A)